MNPFANTPWLVVLAILLLIVLLLLLYLRWARVRGRFPYPRFPREEFYIQDQVIVTGPEAAVNTVIAGLRGVQRDPLRVLRFSELPLVSCEGVPPDLVIGLYRITGQQTDVQSAITQIRSELGGPVQGVDGEPNYLSGHPWDPEGSPWDPEGSPWDPEGSPVDELLGLVKKKTPAPLADPHSFMTQWGFRQIDLAAAADYRMGEGVRVGIFDTSPFYPDLPEGGQGVEVTHLAQTPPELALQVRHPVFRAHPKPSARPLTDVRNHGYFIAGLVHALAPASELHLIRVLERDNRGDLFTLMEAIFDFLREAVDRPAPHGVVINLSLGIRIPPEEAGFDLPIEVRSLDFLMRAARCLNVLVVAAAGNDSMSQAKPLDADLPAGWDTALAVAASNNEKQRACFSNMGELAAPGGDGRPQASRRPTQDAGCRPRNAECTDGNCGASVVGPVIQPNHSVEYIYWSGSSFSAPMVSGLAALVLASAGRRMTPAEVEEILRCGAQKGDPDLGAGVINVRRTLECLQASPTQKTQQQPPVEQATLE